MRRHDLEIRYDDSRPEGGHVVLFVPDLPLPDSPVRVILKPIDTHIDPDRLEELAEPQDAIAATATDDGCEIVLGPQTTSHPALETGTVVDIELVGLDVSGEVVWPAVTPLVRPRRSGLQIKKVGTARGGANGLAEAQPQPRREAPRAQAVMMRAPAVPIILPKPPVVSAKTDPAPLLYAEPAAGQGRLSDDHGSSDRASPSPVSKSANVPEDTGVASTPPASDVIFYPHARGSTLHGAAASGTRRRATLLPTSPGGAALSTAVVILGLFGLYSMSTAPAKPIVATPAVTQPAATTPGPAVRTLPDAANELSLYDLLAPGATSPRGIPAKDVAPQKALELAHTAFLTPGGQRDPEEGAFWLRRYLATIGAEERTRRALTQLGSAYADSFNKNFDFARARQAWELASAFGDPVAMCFLGVMHENGLAGPVDKKVSLIWFERAKAAGGCPGLDEAITRVKS